MSRPAPRGVVVVAHDRFNNYVHVLMSRATFQRLPDQVRRRMRQEGTVVYADHIIWVTH